MRSSRLARRGRASTVPWSTTVGLYSGCLSTSSSFAAFATPRSAQVPSCLPSLHTPWLSSCRIAPVRRLFGSAAATTAMVSNTLTCTAFSPLTCAVRHASYGAATTTSAASSEAAASAAAAGGSEEGSSLSSDPMSMAASPQYTSHSEAERVAYQQEDNVQHRDFGVGACGHGEACNCGGGGASASDEDAASAAAVPPHRQRDFSTVFHQEVAAWRASQKQHQLNEATSGEASLNLSPVGSTHRSNGSLYPEVRPEDVPPGMTTAQYMEHLKAEEEMQRFLAQNTMHSIRRSMDRENAAAEAEAALTASTMRARLEPHRGYRGVQTLLDYNKQWAAEVSRFNPRYFVELAKEQKPEYLWIGCSDSRVPANEVIGLHPGDVFVHRNIGNIFSLSDLNCLSALQFAVDCLKVQHVIIAGHYKCGGVTAAMRGDNLGLTDHWIMQVADIKNKWWDRVLTDIPEDYHLSVLCELNVLEQLSHVVSCRIVQRRWKAQNANDRYYGRTTNSVYVRPEYATKHLSEKKIRNNLPTTVVNYEEELEVHGWVYSLDDGMLRPLLSLTRHSNVKKEIAAAIEALFIRYSQMA